jgi:hypothetical protein
VEVQRLTEGEYFVQGTLDLEEARIALEEHDEVQDEAPEDVDWEVRLVDPVAGHWRKVPCKCGEHGWHLIKGSGRGATAGVFTDITIDALWFDGDEPLDQ